MRVEQTEDVSQLPNGISTIFIGKPGHITNVRPTKIKAPKTRPDQYWCVVRIHIVLPVVICPGSDVKVKTRTLRTLVKLAANRQTIHTS